MKQDRRTFLRNVTLAGAAARFPDLAKAGHLSSAAKYSSLRSTPEGVDGASVRQHFQSPPKQYRPIVRWWWPGNDVTEVELRREIRVLDEAGFGGAEIQAFFKGLPASCLSEPVVKRINSYATPSFFQHVGVAIEEARKHGLFIDYTFGTGWPFGGGYAITPELASIELRSTHRSIEGPARLRAQLQMPSVTDGDPSKGGEILKGLPEGWAERLKKRTNW